MSKTNSANSEVNDLSKSQKSDDLIIDIGLLSELPLKDRKAKIYELKNKFDNQAKNFKSLKSVGNVRSDVLKTKVFDKFSLNQLMKEWTENNTTTIEEQINNMVALYNIGDKKAFYFITSVEARKAIQYINDMRNDYLVDREMETERDLYIENYFKNNNIKEWQDIPVNEKAIVQGLASKRKNGLIIGSFLILKSFGLNTLNEALSNVEKHDLIVNALVVNSHNYSIIRNWGKTVYDEFESKVICNRKLEITHIMGHVFTADIYVCNKIPNDRMFLVNYECGMFDVNMVS